MLTEVMQHYGLAHPPIDARFFETPKAGDSGISSFPRRMDWRPILRHQPATTRWWSHLRPNTD